VWRGVAQLAAVTLLGLAFGACGGDGDRPADARRGGERARPAAPPAAAEPARAAGSAIVRAARDADCRAFGERLSSSYRMRRRALCPALERSGALEAVAAWDGRGARYGTVALGEVLLEASVFVLLAVDRDERYAFMTTVVPRGTPSNDLRAQRALERGLRLLRERGCRAFARLVVRDGDPTRERGACRLEAATDLRRALRSGVRPRIHRFGGNGFASAFGIDAGRGGFFSAVVATEGDRELWAGLVRSR
jgi:hypothetical protein